jgi:mannose-1-phosphate guanylyltransferase/mannose-6-phosphate isomerase
MRILSLILAGGKGERFWPLSRKNKPKQLLDLFTGKPLILEAYERAKLFGEVYIITTQELQKQIKKLIKDAKFIIEPFGKNTAPAIYYSIKNLKIKDDDIIFVQTSDHIIKNFEAFKNDVNLGIEIAKMDYIVVFGIKPNRIETGFGYVEVDYEIRKNVYKVKKFYEKPSFEKAKEYVKMGNFYWNSGMFIFNKRTILKAYEKFANDIIETFEKSRNKLEFYKNVRNISIDYAIMEKSDNIALVKASFEWEDLGLYTSLENLFKKDEDGNIVFGEVAKINTKNCIIISKDGICGVYGVENLIIVKTKDAVLVIPKENAQNVRDIVNLLKKLNFENYL